MRNEYEQLVDYAYSLLLPIHKEYLKGNTTAYPMIILGVGNCRVENGLGNGHNYQAVIDAIHKLYLEDKSVREGFYSGLVSVIQKSSNYSIAQTSFNCLYYQAKKETDGTASFRISHQDLFDKLQIVLRDNIEVLKSQEPMADRWLEEIKDYYQQYSSIPRTIETKGNFISTDEVFSNIQRTILGGQKVPHSVSRPVLYNDSGSLKLAVFVFFYTKMDIKNGAVDRPTVWAKIDMESGVIVDEISTKDIDFSDASYDIKYNVRSERQYNTSKEYYQKAFTLLDEVRRYYLSTGKILISEYEQYIQMILANIPDDYKRFYKDLSAL